MSEEGREGCEPQQRSLLSRILWNFLGTIFLVLGIIGAALPIMPTAPFIIVSAACYAKGSEKMHQWLMNNRYFGKYLRDYAEKRGMAPRSKALSILCVWAGILFSAYFFVHILWAQIAMIGIAVAVTIHLLALKTVKD